MTVEQNVHVFCSSMLHDIRQCLLCNAKERCLYVNRQSLTCQSYSIHFRSYSVGMGKVRGIARERCFQPHIVQHGWTQPVSQSLDFLHGLRSYLPQTSCLCLYLL